MKQILIPIILILVALNVKGQNHLVGIKGGINRTNFSPKPSVANPKSGVSAGLTYDYLIGEKFYLSSGVLYNVRSIGYDVSFTDSYGNPINGSASSIDYNFNYISVPIKAGLNFGRKFFGFSEIGLLPSLLLNTKIKVPDFDSNGQPIGTKTIKNDESEFDLAGIAEIGVGYKFVEKYWLYTSFSYIHGLTTSNSHGSFQGSNHYGINASVGLKVVL